MLLNIFLPLFSLCLLSSKVEDYTTFEEVFQALMANKVKGILIDAYEAGSKTKTLSNPLLNTQKVFDYSSTYGVVLAGESVRLHQCSKEYIKANKMKITQQIAKYIEEIKVGKRSN